MHITWIYPKTYCESIAYLYWCCFHKPSVGSWRPKWSEKMLVWDTNSVDRLWALLVLAGLYSLDLDWISLSDFSLIGSSYVGSYNLNHWFCCYGLGSYKTILFTQNYEKTQFHVFQIKNLFSIILVVSVIVIWLYHKSWWVLDWIKPWIIY